LSGPTFLVRKMRMIIQKGLHIFDQSFHALTRESNYEPIPIFWNNFETNCVVFTENRTHQNHTNCWKIRHGFAPLASKARGAYTARPRRYGDS
jgi:hypothetical protein